MMNQFSVVVFQVDRVGDIERASLRRVAGAGAWRCDRTQFGELAVISWDLNTGVEGWGSVCYQEMRLEKQE